MRKRNMRGYPKRDLTEECWLEGSCDPKMPSWPGPSSWESRKPQWHTRHPDEEDTSPRPAAVCAYSLSMSDSHQSAVVAFCFLVPSLFSSPQPQPYGSTVCSGETEVSGQKVPSCRVCGIVCRGRWLLKSFFGGIFLHIYTKSLGGSFVWCSCFHLGGRHPFLYFMGMLRYR